MAQTNREGQVTRARPLRISMVGQALISRHFEPPAAAEWAEIRSWLADADVNFTNLEVSLLSARAGGMMKSPEWTTSPRPDILELLTDCRFNLLSLANNHSWDLGPAGILDTIDEVRQRGVVAAGTGRDLETAGAPAVIETDRGSVALIAMASGNLPEPAFATSSVQLGHLARPGVNPLRVRDVIEAAAPDFDTFRRTVEAIPGGVIQPDGTLDLLGQKVVPGSVTRLNRVIDGDDLNRNLDAIRDAASRSDLVLVYFHQHHWEREWQSVGQWLRDLARACIDAGADAFLGHGVPMLQPFETYEGRLISYSLGNFVFHPTNGPTNWPDKRCWRSVVVQAEFAHGAWQKVRLRPITLAADPALQRNDFSQESRIQPMPASHASSVAIFDNLDEISRPFGTRFERHAEYLDLKF